MTSPSPERVQAFDRACEAALAAFVEESGGFGEEDDRKLMLLVVRAVLQAIHEPDEDALAASNFGSYMRTSATGVWQAMITAILAQGEVQK